MLLPWFLPGKREKNGSESVSGSLVGSLLRRRVTDPDLFFSRAKPQNGLCARGATAGNATSNIFISSLADRQFLAGAIAVADLLRGGLSGLRVGRSLISLPIRTCSFPRAGFGTASAPGARRPENIAAYIFTLAGQIASAVLGQNTETSGSAALPKIPNKTRSPQHLCADCVHRLSNRILSGAPGPCGVSRYKSRKCHFSANSASANSQTEWVIIEILSRRPIGS
jgi:hypothetical protein